jgi:hypothetical protein
MLEAGVVVLAAVGTVLLAILSGAGGSALLELYYKPRRDLKRVCVVLYAELLQNAQMILLWAHTRKTNPKAIPSDFQLSVFGMEVVSDLLRELPAHELQEVLLLYSRFEASNQMVAEFASALDQYDGLSDDAPRKKKTERLLDTVIDSFNTGLDSAFEQTKRVLPRLMELGGIKEEKDPNELPPDYEDKVRQHLAERELRLAAIRNRSAGEDQ